MDKMASSSSGDVADDKRDERRKQVMLGELPPDFLRVTPMTQEQQVSVDEQAALALQQQLSGNFVPANVSGRLSISVIEAKLTKNYGVTRMDPYVRLRIGQTVYETHTDYNGAKNPRWNKVFHCFLFPNVNTIYIEIFDEVINAKVGTDSDLWDGVIGPFGIGSCNGNVQCPLQCAFTLDEKVAWAHYAIPESVFQGETLDEWIPLSGRQGDGKEGFINLVLTYITVPGESLVYPPQPVVAVMPAPYYGVLPGVPYCTQVYSPQYSPQGPVSGVPQQPSPPQQSVPISEEDIKQVKEMFPNMEDEVIRTVMESNCGNKDRTINALLTLNADS